MRRSRLLLPSPATASIFVYCFLSLTFAGCTKHAAATRPSRPPSVNTITVRNAVIHPTVMLAGLISPFQNVAIQSSLSEPADSVEVKEGDRVRKGETLAQLDTADLQAQYASDVAQANSAAANTTHTVYQGALTIAQSDQTVQSAQATLHQAVETQTKDALDLQRYRQLLRNGYVSAQQETQQLALVRNDQQAVRSAQASLTSARDAVQANGTLGSNGAGSGLQASSVEQARASQQVALAQAQQVRTSITKATLTSPIDGVVVNRNLNVGEYPGTRQLFTLQQVDNVYVILRGSGEQISQIQTGAVTVLRVSDLKNGRRYGSVAGVLNQINPGSTDFVVKVIARNVDGKLRPGMAVTGEIALPALRGLRLPTTAFTDDTHGDVMVVGSDATVRTVKVVENGSDGKNSVVTGIASGTRVIANGQSGVGNGEKVAVR